MDYLALKHLHMGCAALSIMLFVLRASLQLAGVAWRRHAILRIAPHCVDTVLLAAAIGLTLILQQYPFSAGWLTAKLLALVAYVLLGRQALRPGISRRRNAAFFFAALLAASYIVAVAITHSASLGQLQG